MDYFLNAQPYSTVSNYSEAVISRNSAKITEHLSYICILYFTNYILELDSQR